MDHAARTWLLGIAVLAMASGSGAGRAPETAPVPAGRDSVLRVVTFNLFHGGPTSGLWGDDRELDRRVTMVIEGLRALDPDVITLQEASVGLGRPNVAARIARALGYHHVHAAATPRVFREPLLGRLVALLINFAEGPAIVSRFPIVRTDEHDLPRCAKLLDPRVVVHAEVTTPWGPLQVLSTHTSHDVCQLRRVGELARSLRGGPLPAILGGDLNHTEDSPAMRALLDDGLVDAFRRANPGEPGLTVWQRVTAPEPTVFRRVDYVLLAPGAASRGRVVHSRVVLDTPERRGDGTALWPSDHYGVMADVDLSR